MQHFRRSDRPHWSCPELALSARAQGIVERISASTVHRWLRADVLKPWQQQERELRELVCHRAKLVALRSGLKAQVHATLAKQGQLPEVSGCR